MAGRQAGPKAPLKARERGGLGLEARTKEGAGVGVMGAKDLTYTFLWMQNVFYRNFPFWKIKVCLRFRVRDNVITMTHIGRHEQMNVSVVLLKHPNQTLPSSLAHHKMHLSVFSPCVRSQVYPTPWIHCQITNTNTDHRSSPEGSPEHGERGGLCMRKFPESRVGWLLFPFLSHSNRHIRL